MIRFDRFTKEAQDVAQRAIELLKDYKHNQLATEHILLALIENPESAAASLLSQMDVSAETLADRIDFMLRTRVKADFYSGGSGQLFITPEVRSIIDKAPAKASRLKANKVPPPRRNERLYLTSPFVFKLKLNE